MVTNACSRPFVHRKPGLGIDRGRRRPAGLQQVRQFRRGSRGLSKVSWKKSRDRGDDCPRCHVKGGVDPRPSTPVAVGQR